jgi:hypothetical protein
MEIIIIGLALWAIALEWRLRKQDATVSAMAWCFREMADGKAKVARINGAVKVQLINKEK